MKRMRAVAMQPPFLRVLTGMVRSGGNQARALALLRFSAWSNLVFSILLGAGCAWLWIVSGHRYPNILLLFSPPLMLLTAILNFIALRKRAVADRVGNTR